MRFFGFFLGICEANAYSSFRVFSYEGRTIDHSQFKDNMAYAFLKYCEALNFGFSSGSDYNDRRVLRSDGNHQHLSMNHGNGRKPCHDRHIQEV
ncbi:hypothetical protein BD408DRAFT_418006 [Parasitella parasitica]|nr:hypothetical protein BD408DRAFT_418006 [Parasitella parasitica]